MQKSNSKSLLQSSDIQIERFIVEQGLAGNEIFCIFQDSQGFIWFGTSNGLKRYDGYKFKVFRNNSNDSTSLSRNCIISIYEDRSGHIWIGTEEGGLNKFSKEKEQFIHYRHDPDNPISLSNDYIHAIHEDNSRVLWIGTEYGGLNKFDREKEKFKHYKNNPDDPASLSCNFVRSIYEDNCGTLWIGTKSGGLNKFDKEKEKFKCFIHNPDDSTSLSSDNINRIYEDNCGTLWIGTGKGLHKYNREKEQFKRYMHNPDDPTSLSNNVVTSIYEDNEGMLWIGTAYGGLNKFSKEKEQFTHYKHDPDNSKSLSNNCILVIHEDNSGNLLVGTAGGGLNKSNKARKQFKNYFYVKKDPISLSCNIVMSIYGDNSDNLWIGTLGGGLSKFDREKEQFIHYKHNPDGPASLSHNFVESIYVDNSDNLWIGTRGGGLNKFNKEKEQFTHYRHDPENPTSLSNDYIYTIYEDNSENLWIGTHRGLNKFNKLKEEFTQYKHDPQNSSNKCFNYVSSIIKDKLGNFWIGTEHGLIRFDRERNRLIHCRYDSNNPSSLSCDNVTTIYEDNTGVLWIGTKEGLNKFNNEYEKFIHFREKDGLPSDLIHGILEDDYGNLWISTEEGLSKFNPKAETFRNYDVKDGLQSNDFNRRACYKNRSGEMFFGGMKGFTMFHPDDIKDNPHIPPVVITDFQLLHKSVPIGFDKSTNRTILEKSITETKEIELNYEDNVISFEFSALDFQCPEKNQYAYIMEGFDKDWIYTDASRRFATYTNLDPGAYTFRVKGSNNNGIWNEEGASLKIKILPEMRSRFFADISHEFRTPLTLILGPLKQIIEKIDDPEVKREAKVAEKSAERLNVLVNQLLDLSRVVTRNMKLKACSENIIPLLKGLTLSFASLAERKKIALKFISKRKILKVYVDRDKVEKIVTNILSNAFKFTEEGGRINVSIQSTDGKAEIRISDTGIGIPKERLDKIFDRFYQVGDTHKRRGEGAGIGLALTKELVELHKGEIKVESEEGKGTIFIVSLPLGKDHLLPEEITEVRIGKEEEPATLTKEIEEDKKEEKEFDIDLITETEKPLLLIVEDNSDVRTYIRGHLDESYRISEAIDGKDGMDKALDYIPDLIVSDVMMPEMDGIELCKEIKKDERISHIPIILLTAKAASEDKIEGLETGADDYIMKPFDAKELQARIKNLVEQRKKLRERFNKEATIPIKKGKYSQIDEEFLKKTMEVVEKHISEPEFKLDDFGKEIGMSRTQLHRKVRALTNYSPHNFIRFIRLKHAAELLSKGAGNVTEIAYDVGFSSLSHFAKAFKEQFGKSPSDYIKSVK
ncbi:two-component regulator propeller domain-containing protein [Bacteroidota bacterium]